jgi:DNA-binding response OmpR family regulator
MNVLFVAADSISAAMVVYALHRGGHHVTTVSESADALHRGLQERPGLVLLDATPSLDAGLAVCRLIRQVSSVPVILINASGDEASLVRGYEAGADDCIIRPFSTRHLLVRIDAVMRRVQHIDEGRQAAAGRSHIRVGDIIISPAAFEAYKNGMPLRLTRLEFRILCCLAENAGVLVSAHHLADYAWQSPTGGDISLLKTHMSHLRQKLRESGGAPVHIRAIPRTGYILATPASGRPVAAEPGSGPPARLAASRPWLDQRPTAGQPLRAGR